MKAVIRSAKNVVKGYTDIQIKVREASSNDPSGPSLGQLEYIINASFQPYILINVIFSTLFSEIIYIIDKRLNDHGKNWRHVYKALLILEYGICCGPESMVSYAKDAIYVIKTLKEFQFIDEHGRDNGAMVRAKSREIVALLENEDLLIEARNTKSMPLALNRSSPKPLIAPSKGNNTNSSINSSGKRRSFEDLQNLEEDEALNRALEESKREYERNQTETTTSRTGSLLDLSEVSPVGHSISGDNGTLSNAVLSMQYYQEHRASMPVVYPSHHQIMMNQPIQIHQQPPSQPQFTLQALPQSQSFGLLLHQSNASASAFEGRNSNPNLPFSNSSNNNNSNRTYSIDSGMQIRSPPSTMDPFKDISNMKNARNHPSYSPLMSNRQKGLLKDDERGNNPFDEIAPSSYPSNSFNNSNNNVNDNGHHNNPFQTLSNPFGEDESVFIPVPNSNSTNPSVGGSNIGAKPVLPLSSNQFFSDLSRENNNGR